MTAVARVVGPAAASGICLQCPSCGQALRLVDGSDSDSATCARCGFVATCAGGIWRMLPPHRAAYYQQFMREYAEIRAREGRQSQDRSYYLALPFKDLTGRNSWQWAIRAKTFRCFSDQVLRCIERERTTPLHVLDIGAGNGWLACRLALRGHYPVALDLLDNEGDGLGAAANYFASCGGFVRVQAEMDRLPFAAGQFDLVVFNASFHYSERFSATIREALRCTSPGGHIVILDSPLYRDARSGEQMVAERHEQFRKTYGFASDSIPSREFLSSDDIATLRRAFAEWRVVRPWYGWKWALRPWKARLQRRREPSKFHIFWGRVPQ